MGKTVERRLKDYKGFQVWKVTENKGCHNEKTTYWANTHDGDNYNVFPTLARLKLEIDKYIS